MRAIRSRDSISLRNASSHIADIGRLLAWAHALAASYILPLTEIDLRVCFLAMAAPYPSGVTSKRIEYLIRAVTLVRDLIGIVGHGSR